MSDPRTPKATLLRLASRARRNHWRSRAQKMGVRESTPSSPRISPASRSASRAPARAPAPRCARRQMPAPVVAHAVHERPTSATLSRRTPRLAGGARARRPTPCGPPAGAAASRGTARGRRPATARPPAAPPPPGRPQSQAPRWRRGHGACGAATWR